MCTAAVVGLHFIDVDQLGLQFFGFKWPLHCALKHTFGIKCALCGITHSFCATARGEMASAFGYHRLGPVLFGFIILEIVYRMWAIIISPKKVGLRMRKMHVGLIAVIIIAIFVNWVIYLGGRLV